MRAIKSLIAAALLLFAGSAWAQSGSGSFGPGPQPSAGIYLPLAGGTMTGNIAMGGNAITGGGAITGTALTGATANITTLGTITAVAYGFNSAKTGLFSGSQDSNIQISINGTSAIQFGGSVTLNTLLIGNTGSSFELNNAGASSTVPTLIPNRGATTTGIGAQASGNLSEIIVGAEVGRWTSTGLNNAVIGATTPAAGSFTYNTGTGDFVCAPITSGALSQGVTTCVASDKRVKNDLGIITPEKAVARVMALPDEHRFTYKAGYGPSGDHTGWWAQDIQKIWPGVVYKGKKMPITPDGELTFDRGEIGPDTTTAVKWLVGQVTDLKAQNASLRAANDNLGRRLSALETHRKLASAR